MRQFIAGSDSAFEQLGSQATGATVVFAGQEMPRGGLPRAARVGFEVDPSDGAASLLVDRGLHYSGENVSVREWLERGERRFADFGTLVRWIRGELAGCYSVPEAASAVLDAEVESDQAPEPGELTDLEAVGAVVRPPGQEATARPETLFREMSRRVRGQDKALRALCAPVCLHLARAAPRRPATFFAIGPTGVGKTRTAEVLPVALKAAVPRSPGYGFLRLDMSEYQEGYRVSQLLGSPQGYVGYGEGAQLVDALARNPRTIVLFDEIEKAHPNILRTLMNAMDAGRLSTPSASAAGRELDCRKAIFIFTTNLEAGPILKELDDVGTAGTSASVDAICRRHLRAAGLAPELVGRVRRFLVFRPLGQQARAEIITLAVARVAEEYGLRVERIHPSVIAHVLGRAGGEVFGVRPDEYLVDELLGGVFAAAASSRLQQPLEITEGPPFSLVPITSSVQASEQDVTADV